MDIKREPEEILHETDDEYSNLNMEYVEQNLENISKMERQNILLKEDPESSCQNNKVHNDVGSNHIKQEIHEEWQQYKDKFHDFYETTPECSYITPKNEITTENSVPDDTTLPKIEQEFDPDCNNTKTDEIIDTEDNVSVTLSIEYEKDNSKKEQSIELFPCDHCDKIFKRLYTLKKHKSIYTKEKLFACDVCDFTCRFARNLPQHKLTHTQDRPFACEKCSYTTKHAFVLRQHMLVHSDEKPYSCNLCSYRCKRRSFLTLHQFKHANMDQLRHACTRCEFRCKYTKEMIAHEISHTNDGRFACEKCYVVYNVYNELKMHRDTHDEKIFACTVCDYKTKRSDAYKSHVLVHSGDKPYKCEQCNYATNYARNLITHKLTHGEDKSYSCDECNYKCKIPRYLKSHKLIHLKDKNVVLSGC